MRSPKTIVLIPRPAAAPATDEVVLATTAEVLAAVIAMSNREAADARH